MKTAIIIGHTGQDGIYLSRILQVEGFKVYGVSKSSNDYNCNIIDYNSVSILVDRIKPQYIFHLGAVSKTSHEYVFNNFDVIVRGTLNILEAVKTYSPETIVFITGSGLQFKNIGLPIKETDDFEARDAYSLSRIQSVYTARYYRSIGIKVYVGYLFNHDSPYRNENHMTQKIVKAAKRIANGSSEKIEIGDLDSRKEYSFAGDIVNGIWMLVNQDAIFEATIGSGLGFCTKEWLELSFLYFGLNWEDYVIVNSSYNPPYQTLVSNPETIRTYGWKPEMNIVGLNSMMIERQ